jgi:hypothetical protein
MKAMGTMNYPTMSIDSFQNRAIETVIDRACIKINRWRIWKKRWKKGSK